MPMFCSLAFGGNVFVIAIGQIDPVSKSPPSGGGPMRGWADENNDSHHPQTGTYDFLWSEPNHSGGFNLLWSEFGSLFVRWPERLKLALMCDTFLFLNISTFIRLDEIWSTDDSVSVSARDELTGSVLQSAPVWVVTINRLRMSCGPEALCFSQQRGHVHRKWPLICCEKSKLVNSPSFTCRVAERFSWPHVLMH